MALIKCNECGNEVSDKATSCPTCGAPIEKQQYRKVEENTKNNQNSQEQNTRTKPESKKSNSWKIITFLIVILIGFFAFLLLQNNPNSIPGVKIEINPPNPIVFTSRADQANSTLIKLKTTVYTTIQNLGGDGNVLVTFLVSQAGNDYKRSQSISMRQGEQVELKETFAEVKMLDGQITYDVKANAE